LVPAGAVAKGLYWLFALAACMSVTWFFVLSPEERAELNPSLLIG
jgi:hypothetical protein